MTKYRWLWFVNAKWISTHWIEVAIIIGVCVALLIIKAIVNYIEYKRAIEDIKEQARKWKENN